MKEAFIKLENLSLHFQLLDSSSQSLKRTLVDKAVGGVLGKSDNKKTIIKSLDNISLTIKKGDRVGLIGHNGSGKSTLLQTLSGIYQPTSGTIKQEGTIVSVIDLNHGLDPEATGYENILLKGMFHGNSMSAINESLEEIIQFSELRDFIHVPMKNYSMGMKLRLAFSAATFQKPQIFLLDEWLSVGDESFVRKCEERLNKLISESEILVLATHDINLIKRVCNKVIKLESGKIVEEKKI